jgi:hypothetical protein
MYISEKFPDGRISSNRASVFAMPASERVETYTGRPRVILSLPPGAPRLKRKCQLPALHNAIQLESVLCFALPDHSSRQYFDDLRISCPQVTQSRATTIASVSLNSLLFPNPPRQNFFHDAPRS